MDWGWALAGCQAVDRQKLAWQKLAWQKLAWLALGWEREAANSWCSAAPDSSGRRLCERHWLRIGK